jgi:hypothetical protein
MKRFATLSVAVIVLIGGAPVWAQPNLSVKMNDIVTNIADGDPFPDNLFDTSGPNPFSGTTTNGGDPMLAAVWEQTIVLGMNGAQQVGSIIGRLDLGGQLQQQIIVTELASRMLYYEPVDGNITTAGDPFLFSQFNMAGGNPMVLDLVDSDNNGGNGFTPYINDLFPIVPVQNGTEIAVWQGQPIQVEIVALTLAGLVPIATNTMVPFEFYADDGGINKLDNLFGVFEDDWVLPLGPNVLLSDDGTAGGNFVMSPFLKGWPNLPQTRAKGHPGGVVNVVIGSALPGPAGIFHPTSGIPLPAAVWMAIPLLGGMGVMKLRRSRRAA